MRDYGKVHSCFWSSATVRSMSEDGRMLALYLLTCPHGTIAGVFRAPDGYICEDIQWSSERVNETVRELLENGFANRCGTTKWIWVVKHLEWNPPENPNQRKAALKQAIQIPDECCWKQDYIRVYGALLGVESATGGKPLGNPSATVPKPVTVTVTVTETETVTETVTGEISSEGKSPHQKMVTRAKLATPDGVSESVWADFLAHRNGRKAKVTQTVIDGLIREAGKAGLPLQTVLETMCQRGWTGFKADWIADRSATRPEKFDPVAYINRNRTENIIDVTPVRGLL